ncbi:MAG TPA: hypothetical protein VM695_15040 [Phycisphaerae bacterium]|nr:hypothetical protein [Phycisphaerae bacterium]
MRQANRTSWSAARLVVLCALAAAPAARGQENDFGERKIAIEQVPAVPRAAILKAVGDGRIADIGEIRENGKVVRYDVECIRGGKEIDIIVAPDGKLLTERDEGTSGQAPAAATIEKGKLTPQAEATVRKTWPKATIKDIDVEGADGISLHKIELSVGGKEMEAEIAPDGTLVSTQTDVAEKDLPAGLRAAVRKVVGDGTIGTIEKEVVTATVEKGRIIPLVGPFVLYEVKFSKGTERHEVKLSPDGSPACKPGPWRSVFAVDKKLLASAGHNNPYFPLVPGYRIHLSGGGETVIISVLDETKVVDGVETRVVEERESKDKRLVEVSRNYMAIDRTTGDVYYFGEDVDVYDRSGKVAGHGGAWLAGVNGARFGLLMPAAPVIGDRYYQEVAPKIAMDRAENVTLHATLKTPMKTFGKCLYVRESSDLESGFSHKWYAAGIGMIGDDELRLVKVEAPAASGD